MPRFEQFRTQYATYLRGGKVEGWRSFPTGGRFWLDKNMQPDDVYERLTHALYGARRPGQVMSDVRPDVKPDMKGGQTFDDAAGTTYHEILVERNWYRIGRPHYKVWPSMVDALMNTKINIGCEHLHMPFPLIEIRLPPKHYREDENAPWLRAMLVTKQREPDGEKLLVFSQFAADKWALDHGGDEMTNSVLNKFALIPGDTIDTELQRMPFRHSEHQEGGPYWPNRDCLMHMTALAVGVCFIAIGKDRSLVRPATLTTRERIKSKKRHGRPSRKGWEVGADIKLPKLRDDRSCPGHGEGSKLQFGHIRSGHMRWQPTGPREEPIYKLIFVPPTVVRPDLPMKPRLTPRSVRQDGPDA